MEGPALRDVERWKDKIEVRLDNRQVFFLFFGSAMVACMLFVLGVIVGKRLETRGRAEAPNIEDPLAVLDQFRAAVPTGTREPLTFPRSLIGSGTSPAPGRSRAPSAKGALPRSESRPEARPELAGERLAVLPAEGRPMAPARPILTTAAARVEASAAPLTAGAVKPSPTPVPSSLEGAPRSPGAEAAGAAVPSVPKKRAALEATVSPGPRTAAARTPSKLGAPGGLAKGTGAGALAGAPTISSSSSVAGSSSPAAPAPAPTVATAAPAGVASGEKPRGHFLLQLSSFQDRAEAEAFAHRFPGKNAYVVASQIPGKGTWYRVRVGDYATLQEAGIAKATFERDHNVIAYVAGSGPAR